MKGDEDPSGARKESHSSADMDDMDECSSNSKSYPRMFCVVVLVLALPTLLLDEDDGDDCAQRRPVRWKICLIFVLGRINNDGAVGRFRCPDGPVLVNVGL